MAYKTMLRRTTSALLDEMATFALEKANEFRPMLFEQPLFRGKYTTKPGRRVCLCCKKEESEWIKVTDAVVIEVMLDRRNASYRIQDSSRLEERVRLALENVGDQLKDEMSGEMKVIVLPRDLALLEMLQRSKES